MSGPSFSITALANTALGYFAHLNNLSIQNNLRGETSKWLVANYGTWKTLVEHDPQVGGTTWLHLAYAECIRGVLTGSDGNGAGLSASWRFLNKAWSIDKGLWTEATGHGSPATIRAAYHTVMAFESAKPRSNLLLPRNLSSPGLPDSQPELRPTPPEFRLVNVNGGYTVAGTHGERLPRVVMPPEAQNILRIIASAGRPMSAAELAQLTRKKPNSITKNILEVNSRFLQITNGAVEKLIQATRITDGGRTYYGYCLSVLFDPDNDE
ncbi:hypothetical protein [Arthrobacter sp. NPDC058127]|uniref:hypothetical protein n=1 Tax=Arthrobacter sp. NPDC058127 TaxID=3346351 RepID=UPI0036EB617C